MQNSVSDDCSTEYGTVTWAIEKCDKDPSCQFIHDYGCDDENWRYCPNLLIDESSDNQGEACSRLKPGETLVKNGDILFPLTSKYITEMIYFSSYNQ